MESDGICTFKVLFKLGSTPRSTQMEDDSNYDISYYHHWELAHLVWLGKTIGHQKTNEPLMLFNCHFSNFALQLPEVVEPIQSDAARVPQQ